MTDACIALPQGAGFISSMMSYVDCQAQILGTGAWQALAAPGSTLWVVLTGFLTIFIALIGYNLLLGRSMTVRSGTLAFVKIGAAFALATSWPAYRTLVYDLVTDGPGQLVSEIGPRSGIVGSDGTLLQRLDLADQALAQLAILGTGPISASDVQLPPPPFGGFNSFALGGSRILFLLTAIAGLASVRIVTGLMLALGPFFIAFVMFDSTRSLFEGWIRVLAGAAFAAIGVSIALGLELALVQPWLGAILARRMAGEALPAVATELFVVATFFAIIVVASLHACTRVGRAFRLPAIPHILSSSAEPHMRQAASATATAAAANVEAERTRAAAVANALVTATRRENSAPPPPGARIPFDSSRPSIEGRSDALQGIMPVGRTFTRRATSRVSALAAKRDLSA